jgi:serine protease Do
MTLVRRGLTALLISAVSIGAWMLGSGLVQDVKFARARDQVQASREQLQKVEDFANVYKMVGKAVEPSVVSIEVHKTVKNANRRSMPFNDDLLRRFFPDRNNDGQPDIPDMIPEDGEQIGTGSGVIMQVDGSTGYIVTNNHVAGGAESMTITLNDGREITKAKVVGTDPKSDLAVVKVEADHLIPAKWGNSDELEKGDIIMAFGSPFGYVGSMTHGIVSALNRQAGILGQNGYENFIQVDAPINPGNSGGPLVDLHGDVVGINTAIASRTGGFQGIGFAIPSNQAKTIYEQLKNNGKVVRGFIGAQIRDVAQNLPLAESFGYTGKTGVLVEGLLGDDAPASGKLQHGDIIVAINGKKVDNSQGLRNIVAASKPGDELKFTVNRAGKEQDVTVKIGEQPDDMTALRSGHRGEATPGDEGGSENTIEALGLRLASPSEDLINRFALPDNATGAVIINVTPRSLAAKAGLQPGDLITEVGKQHVANAQEARDALAKQSLAAGIRMYITNRDGSRFVFLRDQK